MLNPFLKNCAVKVMEQSMTMSMISSMTPDEFNQEEDLYGRMENFLVYILPALLYLIFFSKPDI